MKSNKGGARPGAGRPTKATEQAICEKLSPLEPVAFSALSDALGRGDSWAVKMFFEYRFGKPKVLEEAPKEPEVDIFARPHRRIG